MLKNEKTSSKIKKKSSLNYSLNSTNISISQYKKLPILTKNPSKKFQKIKTKLNQRLAYRKPSTNSVTSSQVKSSQRSLLMALRSKRSTLRKHPNEKKKAPYLSHTYSSIYKNFDSIVKNSSLNSSRSQRNKSFSYYTDDYFSLDKSSSMSKKGDRRRNLSTTLTSLGKSENENIQMFKNKVFCKIGKKQKLKKFLKKKKYFPKFSPKTDSYNSLMKLVKDEIDLENYYKQRFMEGNEEELFKSEIFGNLEDINFAENKDDLINIISLSKDILDSEGAESPNSLSKNNKANYQSSRDISLENLEVTEEKTIDEVKIQYDFNKKRKGIPNFPVRNKVREKSHELFVKCNFIYLIVLVRKSMLAHEKSHDNGIKGTWRMRQKAPFYNKEQFLRKYERLRIFRRNMKNRDERREDKKLKKEDENILNKSWGIKTTEFDILAKEDLLLKGYNVPTHIVKSNSEFNDYYRKKRKGDYNFKLKISSLNQSKISQNKEVEEESDMSYEEEFETESQEEFSMSEEEIISPSISEKTLENEESSDRISGSKSLKSGFLKDSDINIIKEESSESICSEKSQKKSKKRVKESKLSRMKRTSSRKTLNQLSPRKIRRKLGDQISIKPAYIDFSKDSQKYCSYWLNCIDSCLGVKFLDLHPESFGYDRLFGQRIQISTEMAKKRIFYHDDEYQVSGFVAYFQTMRRCEFDTEREDNFFLNHEHDLKVGKQPQKVKMVPKSSLTTDKQSRRNTVLRSRNSNTSMHSASSSVRDSVFGGGMGGRMFKRSEMRKKSTVNVGYQALTVKRSPNPRNNYGTEEEREVSPFRGFISPRKKFGEINPMQVKRGALHKRNDRRYEVNSIIYDYLERNGEDMAGLDDF